MMTLIPLFYLSSNSAVSHTTYFRRSYLYLSPFHFHWNLQYMKYLYQLMPIFKYWPKNSHQQWKLTVYKHHSSSLHTLLHTFKPPQLSNLLNSYDTPKSLSPFFKSLCPANTNHSLPQTSPSTTSSTHLPSHLPPPNPPPLVILALSSTILITQHTSLAPYPYTYHKHPTEYITLFIIASQAQLLRHRDEGQTAAGKVGSLLWSSRLYVGGAEGGREEFRKRCIKNEGDKELVFIAE